jgi:MIP family channel proteins
MTSLIRRALAEAFATFGFVFLGVGAAVASFFPGVSYGLLGIALVHGLAIAVMISATMAISGGHVNPAVTVGLFVARRISAGTAVAYVIAQLIGAVLAALAIKGLLPSHVVRAAAVGAPVIANSLTFVQAVLLEAVLTFFLVSAVFGTCVNPDAPRIGGLGVGLVIFADIMVAGTMTGAMMNPARAFGPALVSGVWTGHLAYWLGPILGAVIAGLLWDRLLLPRHQPAG